MPSTSPQTVKLKSTLRLLIPRLRMAQKKDTSLSIAQRREMADLLSQHREASARIRVENIIHTDITVELMEILELYAELLLARAGLLDKKDGGEMADTGLEEAAASIVYAAPRLPREVRELAIVRGMLIERMGKEFGIKANENKDNCVPSRVVDKLKVDPPGEKLVQAYLEEIARTYGVDWPRVKEGEEQAMEGLEQEVQDDEDHDAGGGAKEPPLLADSSAATPKRRPDIGRPFSQEELSKATPPKDFGAKSPVSVAPPGPRTENPSPKVRMPDQNTITVKPPQQKNTKNVVGGAVPTVDDLAKRFSALKR